MRRNGESFDLWRARVRDGAEQRLTETPRRDETWPYWSETARRLVFQARDRRQGSHSDLWLWSPGDAGPRPLTRTPRRDERWPVWSPTAAQLAYSFRDAAPDGAASGVALADVDAPDGTQRLLARATARDFFFRPSFAGDGRRLIAQRRGADGGGSSLWLLATDRAPRRILPASAHFDYKAWFTRDGERIVFSRRAVEGGPSRIVSADSEGGDLRILAPDEGADDHSARPSPTRDEIAFCSDREGELDVFRLELEGSALSNLTRTPDRDEYAPRWSPDGERLVVTAMPVGRGRPVLRDPTSLEGARLIVYDRSGRILLETPGMMADWMPAW